MSYIYLPFKSALLFSAPCLSQVAGNFLQIPSFSSCLWEPAFSRPDQRYSNVHSKLLLMDELKITLRQRSVPTHLSRELEYITFFLMGQYLEIFLFTDGQVYTWGQDSRGQLGLGRERPSANSPQHVKSLSAAPLVQIAAGGEQSFALSVSGAVFGWGRNDRGQLGLGDKYNICPSNVNISLFFLMGQYLEIFLFTDGQVYTWGQDSRGQLGLGRERPSANSPQHVKSLSAAPLVQIAAGGEQSFALSVSGAVFGWGRNDRGQLGLGDATGKKLKKTQHNYTKIIHVSSGMDHTAVLAKVSPRQHSHVL
uniref:RCC1-like domain-containing protein n=1 Tax=Echeneis naucrates TaxID=173247 RepID=A0A665TWZ8_ECHNA